MSPLILLGLALDALPLIDVIAGKVQPIDGLARKTISRDSAGRTLYFSVVSTDFKIFG